MKWDLRVKVLICDKQLSNSDKECFFTVRFTSLLFSIFTRCQHWGTKRNTKQIKDMALLFIHCYQIKNKWKEQMSVDLCQRLQISGFASSLFDPSAQSIPFIIHLWNCSLKHNCYLNKISFWLNIMRNAICSDQRWTIVTSVDQWPISIEHWPFGYNCLQ